MNKHPFTIEIIAHIAVVLAGIVSACLLYQKFIMSAWESTVAVVAALFTFVAIVAASEGCGIFLANLFGLLLQTERPLKELRTQFIFCISGVIVTGFLIFGLAFISIKNIVSLQTANRELKTIDIDSLPTVKPLYEAVKSLELAFKGANEEYQSAQERFKSYTGTNQYQNLGKANQAAVRAQNRKDRLEIELKEVRSKYLIVYNSELEKGTNLLDRADAGFNSKLYVAGMFEVGAALIALVAIMLSAYSKSFTLIYVASFKWPQPKNSTAQKVAEEKSEASAKKEAKISQIFPKKVTEMSLEEMIVAVCRDNATYQDLCNSFNLKIHQARRLVKHTLDSARQTSEGRRGDSVVLMKFAVESIRRMDSVRTQVSEKSKSVQVYQEHALEHFEKHLPNTNGTLAEHSCR